MSWTQLPPSQGLAFGVRISYYCHHGQLISLVNSSVCAILPPLPQKSLLHFCWDNIYMLQILLVSIEKGRKKL